MISQISVFREGEDEGEVFSHPPHFPSSSVWRWEIFIESISVFKLQNIARSLDVCGYDTYGIFMTTLGA